MVTGKLNTVKTQPLDKPPRHYTMTAPVMFSTIDNKWGNGFIHVSGNHIQVIVTVRGEEVLRRIFTN